MKKADALASAFMMFGRKKKGRRGSLPQFLLDLREQIAAGLPLWYNGNKSFIGKGLGNAMENQAERLREKLLNEIYAGAACGLGAMLLDEDRIRNADEEELEELARRYGMK